MELRLTPIVDIRLRFHGTNAIGLPRIVPEGGFVWRGKYIPAGVGGSYSTTAECFRSWTIYRLRYQSRHGHCSTPKSIGVTRSRSAPKDGWKTLNCANII